MTRVIYKKPDKDTEVFIIKDKQTKPFVFKGDVIKLGGLYRDILFHYHLKTNRRVIKQVSLHDHRETATYNIPNREIKIIKSILIDGLKRN